VNRQTTPQTIAARLEELRARLNAEDISTGELIELQDLAEHIQPGDVQLLEAAGVPEFPITDTRTYLDLRCDVTELDTDQRGNLALALLAQTEASEDYPTVEAEIEWNEVEPD